MKTKANISWQEPTIEEFTEHNLTHNTSIKQRQILGDIDHFSPSRAAIQKEEPLIDTMQEDSEDCARKLILLIMAQEASKPGGIHRKNACASLRNVSAILFYCYGQKVENIGNLINKNKDAASKYSKRFVSWARDNRNKFNNLVTPEDIINICNLRATSLTPPNAILEELRSTLDDLLYGLLEDAIKPENHDCEVFLQHNRYAQKGAFDLIELVQTFTPKMEA